MVISVCVCFYVWMWSMTKTWDVGVSHTVIGVCVCLCVWMWSMRKTWDVGVSHSMISVYLYYEKAFRIRWPACVCVSVCLLACVEVEEKRHRYVRAPYAVEGRALSSRMIPRTFTCAPP